MRLAEFILANVEPILAEWEVFARGIWPGAAVDPATLRDHADEILRATARDMTSDQTAAQRADKSKGAGDAGPESDQIDRASETHGADRVGSGFDLWAVVAEYRALRASVLRLWRESEPKPHLHDLDDVTRFNECIDQSLTESVRSFTERVKRDRQAAADELARRANELREVNGALLVSSVRQQELTERADDAAAALRDAKDEAENANRAKDTFLAVLSHELRTPLTAIVGWIDILRSAKRDEADLAEGLDAIDRNTKAQVQLIEDILDVSRIISGKMTTDLRFCDLAAVIEAGVAATRAAAEARGVALDIDLDPSARHTSCDATRMQQVVWNLVSNAIKFTPKGGRISVKLFRHRSNVHIEVSDDGQGIEPEFMPYLFDRFRQADGSMRRKAGGLGLGLSIIKHIVEAHGGTVEAHSDGPGRGATFTVRLPIKAVRVDEDGDAGAGDRSQDAGRFPAIRLDGLRVLVVDDEPDARRLLVRVLERVGAVVTAAASAAEALDALPKVRPDVLVSDLGMPEMDGLDLIRQVRGRGHHAKDLPAVALTAFVQKDDQRLALMAGFQVHVAKPVNPHDLTSVIASLAGRTGSPSSGATSPGSGATS